MSLKPCSICGKVQYDKVCQNCIEPVITPSAELSDLVDEIKKNKKEKRNDKKDSKNPN